MRPRRVDYLLVYKHINDKMRALGLEVIDVPFDQILHAGGGPHCLTQPIERP